MDNKSIFEIAAEKSITIDLTIVKPDTFYEHDIFDEYGNKILVAHKALSSELIKSCIDRGIRYLYYSSSFTESKNPAGLALKKNAVSFEVQNKIRETYRSILDEITGMLTVSADVTIPDVNINKARELIENVIDEIAHNDDAVLVTLKELKNNDEYTFLHSTNVGIIATTLGVRLGYSKDKIIEFGVGALLHDLGKAVVGYHVVNKKKPLTNDEIKLLKEHPYFGFRITENNRNMSKLQKQMILFHHERPDALGYPFGLDYQGFIEHVPKEVRLLSLCDVFSALTSERAYKPAYTQKRALRILQNGVYSPFKKQSQFLNEDFRDFIRGVGFMINLGDYIFDVDEIVRLNTGEVAKVVEMRKSHSLHPVIKVVADKKLQPLKREIVIDMAQDYSLYIAGIIDATSSDGHLLAVRQ